MNVQNPIIQPRPRLAIDGGDPVVPSGYVMMSRWPRLDRADLDAVIQQLESGQFTEMSCTAQVHEFETELAILTGNKYALALNSGTAALHCALAGVGVEPGDEVVVPALAYIACAAAVLHHQAIPIFADVDPCSYNVTAQSIAAALTPRTRAIMVVHLHGHPADMNEIRTLCDGLGLPLIEDFSQAVGASYGGRPTGGLGTVGAASLMSGKNLPSVGEAGVLVSRDRGIRNRAARLKAFGEEIDSDGGYRVIGTTMGWNYRINLLSAVMVSRQIYHLESYTALRRASAGRLNGVLAEITGFSGPSEGADREHCYHMYRFRFDPAEAGLAVSIDQAHEALKQVFWAEGLPVVEFQNQPLPGHDLMQGKLGYGRGCPWTCHGRGDHNYRIEDYPGALEAIRNSLVVGYPSQAVLANPEVVDAYLAVFRKLERNMRVFERFAADLPSAPPWLAPPRIF
ncbi:MULTISPECIES: DegT/DnrJ/EryC1/StrS family aminotransferase [Mesorhizobium]|uniref:dTDP-4-amino-4,6-dideoxygalactose transaminase n=1 Tax=Mesorhizobium qingshengii TaxID=1165689 RepID=A0A1G5ZXQ1_9HYPH|nr:MULTISPECIES: aminotransferase class I/II-fold pyridoxal phosphate-dependent enzyme [Mesorhizobium]AID34839.1 DegT/DnrJ/EryC1/StrS family aminotransferase [Mesorhizobium huakuii 7653R]MCH4560997.1 DegT/DnrJ/EryC1/StrS family aminotransferase [Mesorhizobium jarvisii]SDA99276.1 dTDP-4-amino-4,6-dideoxygalactose transaminase [Mesorhizobium qingshengii]